MVILLNNVVIVPCLLFTSTYFNDYQVIHSFEMEDLPTSWTFVWQLYFCIFVEDIVFTFSHRMLHTKYLYKHIHKLHHTYTQSVGICAEYAHPIEFIFGNVLPLGIPCMMLGRRMHWFTFMAIGTQRIIGTTIGHCGYNIPCDPSEMFPFRTNVTYHDYHH